VNARLNTQTVPISKLVPLPGNPRKTLKPDDPGWRRLVKSLEEQGYVDPLIWNERTGHVLSGNQRLSILTERSVSEVDVVVVDVPPEREMTIALALNNHAGEWDRELLIDALSGLTEIPEFDVELTGFDVAEVEDLLADLSLDEADDDDFDLEAELARAETPVTQPGDLVKLGPHRLLCGDSANADNLDRLLNGAPIHLVNTDPPYNVRVEPRSNNAIAAGHSSFKGTRRASTRRRKSGRQMRAKDRPLVNDYVSDEEFGRLLRVWFGNLARVLLPGRCFYIWGGYTNCANYPPVLESCGLYFSQAIIWVKEHPVLNRKDFMGNHEWCFYGWREGAGHEFLGPANVSDTWSVKKKNPNSMVHLTEKPVELAVRAMHYSSRRGENVLDLFGGSGSTLIGAAQTGRHAYLMEIDPAYCDVIVRRYIDLTRESGVEPTVLERYRRPKEEAVV